MLEFTMCKHLFFFPTKILIINLLTLETQFYGKLFSKIFNTEIYKPGYD